MSAPAANNASKCSGDRARGRSLMGDFFDRERANELYAIGIRFRTLVNGRRRWRRWRRKRSKSFCPQGAMTLPTMQDGVMVRLDGRDDEDGASLTAHRRLVRGGH